MREGIIRRHWGKLRDRLDARPRTVRRIMGTGKAIPRVGRHASLTHATIELRSKAYGCTAVVDETGRLVGAFTDFDLRRRTAAFDPNGSIELYMSSDPPTVREDMRAVDALRVIEENAVPVLFAVDGAGVLTGIVHVHDIVRAGIA